MAEKTKVLLIGLDSAPPELVFDQWVDDLPNLRRLIQEGVYGELKSSDPPITVPAWMSMMTSKDAGELGIYGFRNRSNYSYDGLAIANSRSVQQATVWDILGSVGKKSGLIGVPPSYPPSRSTDTWLDVFLLPAATVSIPIQPTSNMRSSAWWSLSR